MFIDVMDIDSAQYAAISWEMSKNNSFIQIFQRGEDYLDKPPLLFWVSAISFKIFGVSNFVYRLFPLLVCFLGLYSTYQLAKLFYNLKTATLSVIILASSFSIVLMNHDLRTDTMLTGFTVFSIWKLSAYLKSFRWQDFLWGFIGIGFSMLAKGPVGLMIPFFALSTQIIFTQNTKQIFQWKWLLGLLIILIILFPMCYGLYLQFDLHPEKTVNDHKNTSGLYFYFWEQSFGRITGQNSWKNNTSPLFFVHTYLWSVFPWGFISFLALANIIFQFFKNKKNIIELCTIGAFIFSFIILSLSKYKLPHYINILIPYSSIFTANFLINLKLYNKLKIIKTIFTLQISQIALIYSLLFTLTFYFFNYNFLKFIFLTISILILFVILFKYKNNLYHSFITASIFTSLTLYFFLNYFFYPNLLKFQSGSIVGNYYHNNKKQLKDHFFVYQNKPENGKDIFLHSLDFYSQEIQPSFSNIKDLLKSIHNKPAFIYTDEKGVLELNNFGKIEKVLYLNAFNITQLKLKFLNKFTRNQILNKVFLIKFYPN